MAFPAPERAAMLALRGVGDTVIQRLEQLGYRELAQLATLDAHELCQQIGQMLRSTCWGNSPQARASIQAIITLAQQHRDAPR